MKYGSVSGDKSHLLTQNVLLLQKSMEKDIKAMKGKLERAKKEKERHRRSLQNTKVRFPTHTTNVYHSTFIQPSAILMSSDSLPKFTSL